MGLFLSMSGVIGADEAAVVAALRQYVDENQGLLEAAELSHEDDNCLVTCACPAGATVAYPGDFYDWDAASQFLSERLQTPVFSYHIHDGDLWMYLLFDRGELIDQFNPVPDYWEELKPAERDAWQGNAAAIASRVPGVAAEQIAKYLMTWDDDVFAGVERQKAYPTDEYFYGDDWQLLDFMQTLGLHYPFDDDDDGNPLGATYRFKCQEQDSA